MRNIEAQEIAAQISKDQADWIDAAMKKLIPPSLHHFLEREGPNSERVHPRLKRFLHDNRIQIAWIYDQRIPRPRIVVNGQPVAEFQFSLSIDGRPVDIDRVLAGVGGVWKD